MEHQCFVLLPANGFVWNSNELIQFLIANQDKKILIDTHEEGVCLESAGIYQLLENFRFEDVVIRTTNPLEQHSKFKIQIVKPQKFFNITDQNYQQYHIWNKNKIFGCLYNRPLWHRIGIAAEMHTRHNNISLINFRSNPDDPDQQQLFEIQQLFEQAPQSLKNFCQASLDWPVQLESIDSYTPGNTTNAHINQLAGFYAEFMIDLVAETWTQGRCFFPTEKTVRPIMLKKPMIVMGSCNYLDYLHQMGFQTFNKFWDENYDGFADGNRYSKILELIDQLSKLSIHELNDMYQDMQSILDHNYNLLMTKTYTTNINYII
jgi:hypothetical protein